MHQGQVKRGTFRVGQRWTRSQMNLISASLALGAGTETTGGAEATGPPPCCLRQRPVCRRSLSSPRKHKGTTLCEPTSSGSRDPTPVAALCVGDRPRTLSRWERVSPNSLQDPIRTTSLTQWLTRLTGVPASATCRTSAPIETRDNGGKLYLTSVPGTWTLSHVFQRATHSSGQVDYFTHRGHLVSSTGRCLDALRGETAAETIGEMRRARQHQICALHLGQRSPTDCQT